MILDKQRQKIDENLDQAVKQTRMGYTRNEWERITRALEIIHTATRTVILAGLIIIGLWAYAELSGQELHITGKNYTCYPHPNSSDWKIADKPWFPICQTQSFTPMLEPSIDENPNTKQDHQ